MWREDYGTMPADGVGQRFRGENWGKVASLGCLGSQMVGLVSSPGWLS